MIFLIPMAGAAAYGLYKTTKGAMDSSEANTINSTAESLVDRAKRNVLDQREMTNKMLEDYGSRKLRAFTGVVDGFLSTFSRLKNVEFMKTTELDKLQLGDFSTDVLTGLRHDLKLLQDSGLAMGAGLTGGAAVAFGAYNGTMLLATAGTGSAISTLSGVAATNATLAWLGGGTLAAGGGGMAMGVMVLGGLVAAPALLILGYFVGSSGSEALAKAKSNLERAHSFHDEMGQATEQLRAIYDVTALANNTFSKVSSMLRRSTHELQRVIDVFGEDYKAYSLESREVVLRAVKLAQLIKAMIDTPILGEDGSLVLATRKRVSDIAAMAEGREILVDDCQASEVENASPIKKPKVKIGVEAFLSDAWFENVDYLTEQAGDLNVPAGLASLVMNATVGSVKLSINGGKLERGHNAAAGTKLILSSDLFRKIFLEGDVASAMQGFMTGHLKVEGDMSRVMAMQSARPSDAQKALLKQILQLTI